MTRRGRSGRSLLGTSLLAATAALTAAGPARAAGFLIYDLTGEALGKASAVTASTREPGAVWFNPAALVEQGHGVSLSAVGVMARSRFEPEAGGEETKSKVGRFVLPSLFASARVHDRVAVGLGAFPAFGLRIKWPDDWIGREDAIEAAIETFTFNPTVAVRLLPGLSLGAGFQAVRASVEFTNGLPPVVQGQARLGGGTWGFGGNVALLYQPLPERVALALTYRSRVKLDFEGRVDFDPGPDFERSLPDQGGTAELTLPDVITLGTMWRPVPTVTLTFDTNYVLWSTFEELRVDFDEAPPLIMERNNDNVFTFRLGGEWIPPIPALGSALALRAGFIFDQNPSPKETLAPSLPDANRLDFALGLGYRWRWLKADLGYLLVYFLPSEAVGGQQSPEGTYKSIAQLLGLTVSAMFE
jgi:long-chain fatty acid transport protein